MFIKKTNQNYTTAKTSELKLALVEPAVTTAKLGLVLEAEVLYVLPELKPELGLAPLPLVKLGMEEPEPEPEPETEPEPEPESEPEPEPEPPLLTLPLPELEVEAVATGMPDFWVSVTGQTVVVTAYTMVVTCPYGQSVTVGAQDKIVEVVVEKMVDVV
ncbi:hypothetical protein SEPCBS57363_004124 [Sporothrix epigloea]|uniref:Uncharacterized protein n=1 Tax=Sporothrix epigloea TaxID=1892477 RepID=A0ABP0DQD2_9PEZI